MNNAVFRKTMGNVRKNRDIKLVTTKIRRNYLVSEPNYVLKENFLTIEMRKTQVLTNKSVHLGLSISDLSKNIMYEFWYDYLKRKYDENAKLCYMDTDSFIAHVKTKDIYEYITKDLATRFDSWTFELDKPLPKEKKAKSNLIDERCIRGTNHEINC